MWKLPISRLLMSTAGSKKLGRRSCGLAIFLFLLSSQAWAGETTKIFQEPCSLVWTANCESDLAGYRVQEGSGGPDSQTVEVEETILNCWVLASEPGTYVFRVAAYDISGNQGPFSESVTLIVTAGDQACSHWPFDGNTNDIQGDHDGSLIGLALPLGLYRPTGSPFLGISCAQGV